MLSVLIWNVADLNNKDLLRVGAASLTPSYIYDLTFTFRFNNFAHIYAYIYIWLEASVG